MVPDDTSKAVEWIAATAAGTGILAFMVRPLARIRAIENTQIQHHERLKALESDRRETRRKLDDIHQWVRPKG